MIENLDSDIRSELIYNKNPEGKPTLIYVPGLGTMGKSNRRLKNFKERLEKQGHDINIATFTYKSHSYNTVTGFENDSKDLEKIVEKVKQRGASKIGLFAVCYGSYVSLEYLNNNDADAIIMLEPYLGLNSLKGPVKSLAKSAKKIWLPKVPMGFRYDGIGYFDIISFLKSQKDSTNSKNIPGFALSSRHRIFDFNYIAGFMKDAGYEYSIAEKKDIKQFFSPNL